MDEQRREVGTIVPTVGLGLGVLLVAVVVLAALADAVVDRARAQAAADAAALAGAVGGEAEARRFAHVNDARLVEFRRSSSVVVVRVVVDGAEASAAAELSLSKD